MKIMLASPRRSGHGSLTPFSVVLQKALNRSAVTLARATTWAELKNLGILPERSSTSEDRAILQEFKSCLAGGKNLVVYDIGANRGAYSVALAKADAVNKVIAFEPIPAVFEVLTARTRDCAKIVCFNVALGEVDGEATFFLNESSSSSSLLPMLDEHVRQFPQTAVTREIKVPVRRLDDFVRGHHLDSPDVIKIDVQGFEHQVILGAKNCFEAARWCLVEICIVPLYEGAKPFHDIYELLHSFGFEFSEVTDRLNGMSGEPLACNVLFRKIG